MIPKAKYALSGVTAWFGYRLRQVKGKIGDVLLGPQEAYHCCYEIRCMETQKLLDADALLCLGRGFDDAYCDALKSLVEIVQDYHPRSVTVMYELHDHGQETCPFCRDKQIL